MRPEMHAAVSFSLGAALWFLTKSAYAGILCFAAGVFMDADHILEYTIHHRSKGFSFKKVCQACIDTSNQEGEFMFPKLYLFLHAWELAIIVSIAAVYLKNIYLIAFALGYTFHLVCDSAMNPVYPSSYFMTQRILKNFHSHDLIRKKR